MKNIVLILVSALLGAGLAFPIISQNNAAKIKSLQTQIQTLQDSQASAVAAPAPVAGGESPVRLLQRLNTLDPVPHANRAKITRQIVHDLHELTLQGQPALADIRRFLAEGKDIDYVFTDERPQAENFWAWHPGQPLKVGEFILPPSLRLGLIDVCRYIGGEDAEVTLAFVLNSSKRGIEVACCAQILDSMNKGSYHELADGVAKRILASPPQGRGPLDAISTSCLTAMLIAHGDTSLVPSAKEGMIKPDHTLDVEATQYLIGVKKEKGVADLYEAYKKSDTTTDTRHKLASLSLNYVGVSPEADQMAGEMLKDDTMDSNTRSVNILMLANAVPGMHSTVPITAPVAAKRIEFLQGVATASKSEQITKAVAQAVTALQAIK
ncbi:MAG: hypothetical protein RLZZ350_591 [Verrucomicrobiota bacterium]|jgi:hypothetical protein